MANEPYGGMAVSPFTIAPASLAVAGHTQRWRPKPGRTPVVEYKPVKASEIFRWGDLLKVTSAQLERVIDPVGTNATATASGGATLPKYLALCANFTSDSSVTIADRIPVVALADIQILMRMYHATAATSGPDNVTLAMNGVTSGVYYEYVMYEIGTGSDNYQYAIDVANQDDTNGEFKVVEWLEGQGATDNFALGWCETTGK